MKAFLGLVGILQVSLLPGLIFTHFSPRSSIHRLLASVPISLVFNFYLVWGQTYLGLFRIQFVLSIIAIELGLLAFLTWRNKKLSFSSPAESVRFLGISLTDLFTVLLGVLGFVTWLLSFDIFYHNDTWLSFNRWAEIWYSGVVPEGTHRYPQLLPTSLAMIYKLSGDPHVHFYARQFTAIFPLVTALTLLFWDGKRTAYGAFAACVLLGAVLMDWQIRSRTFWFDTADFPAASLIFISIYFLFQAVRESFLTNLAYSVISLAAACLTKQSGLWLLTIYPFICFFLLKRPAFRRAFKFWLLGLLLVIPWYAYKEVSFLQGRDKSEFSMVTQEVLQHESFLDRIPRALDYLISIFGSVPMMILTFLLMGLGIRKRAEALIFFLFFIPHVLLWSFLFSYDRRNLTPVLIWIVLLTTLGMKRIIGRFFPTAATTSKMNSYAVGAIFLLLATPMIIQGQKDLTLEQTSRSNYIGKAELNSRLAEAQLDTNAVRILTNYELLQFVPAWIGKTVPLDSRFSFLDQLRESKSNYVLMSSLYRDLFFKDISELEGGGSIQFLFKESDFYLYKINDAFDRRQTASEIKN